MPKSLVLGNGRMLVGYDTHGQVNDFFYPRVGQDNQMTEESVNKVGTWTDGQMAWLDDPRWQVAVNYKKEALVGEITAENQSLELGLIIVDIVYNERDIYLRRITVKNRAPRGRMVKVYLNHQFRMYTVKKGDTAFYYPDEDAVVHYKGKRVALISGDRDANGMDEYSIGLSNIEGKEGTWRDAEDGELSSHPIEHGTVDSTIGFRLNMDAGTEHTFYAWVAMARSLAGARKLHRLVKEKTPSHFFESTQDYWRAWVNKTNFSFYGLKKAHIDLFKRSLLVIRAHADRGGGIIASGDSDLLQYGRDNYSYVWHRDASFVAIALDKAGYYEVTRRFFEFSSSVLTREGYFFHKYRLDKSLGSSWHPWIVDGKWQMPIQEDETALVIYALWEHYKYTKNLEFIEEIYNTLIKRAANFLLGFRSDRRLPNPTYDLWEETHGIHAFTAATVYAALRSAANFAGVLGKDNDQRIFTRGALEIQSEILRFFYNETENYFYKSINFDGQAVLHDKRIDASSFYGLFRFGVLDVGDERLTKAFDVLKKTLMSPGPIGGVARFVGDGYYRQHSEIIGNPWIITTLWIAQYHIAKAQKEEDMAPVLETLSWVADRATTSNLLSEQVDPYTGIQISASPLTWSHAEYVTTVIAYLEKLESLGICKVCNPIKPEAI